MSIEKLHPSFTFTEDRLKELQSVVPEAFADGKINWQALQEALGEYFEDESQDNFYLAGMLCNQVLQFRYIVSSHHPSLS